MESALVTGGAGFLGSHVARHLVQSGRRVVILDDLSGGFRCNLPDGAEFVHGSLIDQPLIDSLFAKHNFRHVYHLAAYAAEGLSHFVRRFNYENNVMGSANLINASVNHNVECFVFTSSIAVYGASEPPFTEQTMPTPTDPYGIAKMAVELDLQAARSLFGMRYVVFRPHNIYGEHQNLSDPYRNVVGIFMSQVLDGRPCTIYGDGSQTRAFSHVADVAPAIADSPHQAGALDQIFNIGADEPHTVMGLAQRIQEVMGREVGITHLPERHEVQHAFCSHTKVRSVLGLQRTIGLDQGLERMARWARAIERRPPRRFSQIEVAKNLPQSWEHDG